MLRRTIGLTILMVVFMSSAVVSAQPSAQEAVQFLGLHGDESLKLRQLNSLASYSRRILVNIQEIDRLKINGTIGSSFWHYIIYDSEQVGQSYSRTLETHTQASATLQGISKIEEGKEVVKDIFWIVGRLDSLYRYGFKFGLKMREFYQHFKIRMDQCDWENSHNKKEF